MERYYPAPCSDDASRLIYLSEVYSNAVPLPLGRRIMPLGKRIRPSLYLIRPSPSSIPVGASSLSACCAVTPFQLLIALPISANTLPRSRLAEPLTLDLLRLSPSALPNASLRITSYKLLSNKTFIIKVVFDGGIFLPDWRRA